MTTIETDVLVIGGGGAAARAALAAQEAGARTTLAVKGWFGWTGVRGAGATGCGICPWWGYSAGRGVPGKPDEETELNVALILQAGLGMADRTLVRSMVSEQEEARRDLERWGAVTASGFPASDRRRLVMVMPGLACAVRGSPIDVRPKTMITDLLVEDGACLGALGVDEAGEVIQFRAGATVLATGGDAQLYMHNCHPNCVTGDGYAMGYRAGATLINMEFMQSFLVTVHPTLNLMMGGWSWRQYPRIINGLGREFLAHYLPDGISARQCLYERGGHNPFSVRDRASRYLDVAILKENLAGRGTPHHGCFVDGLNPDQVAPEHRAWLAYRGINPAGRLEVSLAHQCSDGGIYLRETAESDVAGLFAAGETAAGMHGADRLGGHMMVNSQVFGRRAGRNAAARAKESTRASPTAAARDAAMARIEALRARKGTLKPSAVRARLHRLCWEQMLAVRNAQGLASVRHEIERIKAEDIPRLLVEGAPDLTQALELENLLLVGEMVARAAAMRTESRGGHYREDFPERNDAGWLSAIRIRQSRGQMNLDTFVIDPDWNDLPGDLGDWFWG
jgi:fumarate reductase (CoM/CoB) subunit A